MSLKTQTNKVSGVINFPLTFKNQSDYETLISKFESFCSNNSKEYYFIYHNRDISANGEFKTHHIHFLIDFTGFSDRVRLSTHLNRISETLNIDPLCVSIEPWRIYESAIQYLIHKNDPTKVLYDSCEIITNQSRAYLDMILSREVVDSITIEQIINLCRQYKSISIVYEKIGLKNSKIYRGVISDIFREFNSLS